MCDDDGGGGKRGIEKIEWMMPVYISYNYYKEDGILVWMVCLCAASV